MEVSQDINREHKHIKNDIHREDALYAQMAAGLDKDDSDIEGGDEGALDIDLDTIAMEVLD